MIIGREKGPQGAVHQTRYQNLIVAGASFTFQKTSGKTARCRKLLAVVHRKRHEIDIFPGLTGRNHSGKKHGVFHSHHNGSVGLLGQLASLKGYGTAIGQFNRFCNYIHHKILLTEIEDSNDRTVTADILAFEVIKKVTALSHKTDQRPTGAVVFLVLFQVLGKVVDTEGKQSYLSFGTPRVLCVLAMLAKNLALFFCC